MGISSKQVTMVTAQSEVWVAGVMQDQIVVTDFVLTIEYCKISDVTVVIKLYANTSLWAHIMVISTCTKTGTPHEKALAQMEMSLLIFFQMQRLISVVSLSDTNTPL